MMEAALCLLEGAESGPALRDYASTGPSHREDR